MEKFKEKMENAEHYEFQNILNDEEFDNKSVINQFSKIARN